MNKTSKLEAILNAWLEFIALVDLNNAKVPGNTAVMSGVELVGNYVQIKKSDFYDLKGKVSEEMGQGETIWVLSFPRLSTVGQGKSEYYPLFSLDVTSILKGEYQEGGWNLDNLELVEAGENLAQFLKLEDEERERLNTQDGLAQFLRSTFRLHFETYEGWMNQVPIPRSYEIERKPYLFPFQGSNFNKHLKQDLKDIQSNPRNWLISKHPADEYLFGTPQPPAHKIKYTGAFPTKPPAYSQLKALKHAQTEPITAVQGPPGSGKTTLILHVIAQQVVKRALSLIETGEDINNLTVVSSTVNKAVENVIEKLDEYFQDKPLQDKFFYLKGGSKTNINSPGSAKELLQSAIVDFLDKNRFDETIFNSLAEEIKKLKADLTIQENHYVNLRRQRDLDEAQQPKLQRKIQELELELENSNAAQNVHEGRAVELELYTQLPIDVYNKIEVIFKNAASELPGSSLPWWRRFLLWLTRRTERQIVMRTASRCEKYILQTFDTPFPIENPTSRSILTQQAGFIRTRLERARELKGVQNQLREVSENINRFSSERDAALIELTALESRLATEIRDFYDYFHLDYHEEHKRLFELARQFLNQQALRNKENVKKALTSYSNFVMGNDRVRQTFSENLESLEENLKAISLIFPVITCTLLSVRNMLPCVSECVDRMIVDEAGMIPQHQTFPLLVRSRRAIIVGDPLQIEPIISLTDQRRVQYRKTAFIDRRLSEIDYHRYSPEQIECATTYHRSAGASGEDGDAGQGIRLIEHFRCQPSIIQFCDRIVGYGLEVKTPPVSPLLETNLIAYHVEGRIEGNVNQEEVTAVHEVIKHLVHQGYSLEDIGVISPFSIHAQSLNKSLRKEFPTLKENAIATVHKFQGSQKRVIILSTKACRPQDNFSLDWMNKRPNLLNVAVSRAEELFILVGNRYRLEKAQGYSRQLVEHIRENGIILEYKSEQETRPRQSGASLVLDCDHLHILRTAIDEAEQELIIVTPWIRGSQANSEPKQFARDIVSALERGVKVTVIYGYISADGKDDNDSDAENYLQKILSQYPNSSLICLGKEKYVQSKGTHERILLCDSKYAVVGSWNWLSHPYRDYCNRRQGDIKAQIRRETSVKLSEAAPIAELKQRIEHFKIT